MPGETAQCHRYDGETEAECSQPGLGQYQSNWKVRLPFKLPWLCNIIAPIFIFRIFRIMDDDGSRSINFEEFQKGLSDYGVKVSDKVRDACQPLLDLYIDSILAP